MGLIKQDGCNIRGVEIVPAYAKIIRILIPGEFDDGTTNRATAYFGISTTRDNLDSGLILDEWSLSCLIDNKKDKIFEEIYNQAKETLFIGWKDSIVNQQEKPEIETQEEKKEEE